MGVGNYYLTIAADMGERKVVFVTNGKDAKTVAALAEYIVAHKGAPEQITSGSIDMSPAFIKVVTEHLPNARITFDTFHVVAQGNRELNAISAASTGCRKLHFEVESRQ